MSLPGRAERVRELFSRLASESPPARAELLAGEPDPLVRREVEELLRCAEVEGQAMPLPPRERTLEVRRTARWFELGGGGSAPPAELWYALHGYGQLAAEVAAELAFLAAPARRVVVPEGLSRFYRAGTSGIAGASWMTREAREAEIGDYVAYLDLLHARVRAEVGGAPAVTLLGFSQGTATASRWVALGGIRPVRLVLWGGGLPPDVDLEGRRDAFQGLWFVAGERDPWITRERLAEERARVEAAGLEFRLTTFVGAHRLDDGVLRSFAGP